MKKYLLPLILILFLTFTLTDYCATYTSQYPPEQSDTYVKSTTKDSTNAWAYFATDPTKSLDGSSTDNSWWSGSVTTNQRFHIDLGSAKIITRIYYENYHNNGSANNIGVQNFTFWGSNIGAGTFDDLVYANDEGWTQITTSQSTFDQHVALDQADPKYITVTNTTAYRYYAFKFADNYGNGFYMGVRRIELQTESADLFGTYDQRIKLTVDYTKIDDTLSNFPVTAFFTDAQAEEVLAEFDADEDFDRGQFALSDDTLLYAEKELFDDSGSKGIYHVKIPSISSSAGTDYYFYYDNDADHNTTYIGAINTTAGGNVWDGNFKAVYHMVDATTSTIVDSTSNNNDGTKKGANEPIEATGKVGQGQKGDGTDDFISFLATALSTSDYTIETVFKADGSHARLISPAHDGTSAFNFPLIGTNYSTNVIQIQRDGAGSYTFPLTGDANWYHTAWIRTSGIMTGYKNGVSQDITANGSNYSQNGYNFTGTQFWALQFLYSATNYYSNANIDEYRISNSARTASWMKATYNSLYDTLIIYGSEETAEAGANSIFFGMNF